MKLRLIIFIVIGLLPVLALAQTSDPNGITYTPEVKIPGLFDTPVTVDNYLVANYLRAVYIYFIWTVGALATVMIIYGGIKWVTAAGNPSRINDARETINSAIIGVIIALISVVLLRIIDPSYTRFGLPNLKDIEGRPFLSNYNQQYKCYESVGCAASMVQVEGGRCGGQGVIGGVFTHVNPGELPCGVSSGIKGICCKVKDFNECVGISSKDGREDYRGKCYDITDADKTYPACEQPYACGEYKDLGNGKFCIGVTSGPNGVCYPLRDQGKGVPITPDSYGGLQPYVFSGLPECTEANKDQFRLYFNSTIGCGQTEIRDTPEDHRVTTFGTKSTCPSGQFCMITPFGEKCELDPSFPRTECVPYSTTPRI